VGIIYRTLFHVLGFQFGDLFASLLEIFASLKKKSNIKVRSGKWKEKKHETLIELELKIKKKIFP